MAEFNPSVSFHLKCKTKDQVDAIFQKLSDGGKVLMSLGSYPWSERYGWLEDKYGLSWQVIYAGDGDFAQTIVPVLTFVGGVCGKAEEAINFDVEVFRKSPVTPVAPPPRISFRVTDAARKPDHEGTVRYASFSLWWADPVAGLLMVPIIAKEGIDGLQGKACDDCSGR